MHEGGVIMINALVEKQLEQLGILTENKAGAKSSKDNYFSCERHPICTLAADSDDPTPEDFRLLAEFMRRKLSLIPQRFVQGFCSTLANPVVLKKSKDRWYHKSFYGSQWSDPMELQAIVDGLPKPEK
jgi:hypothetical protein